MKKAPLILFVLLFCGQYIIAQTNICMVYDAAGNRTQRKQCAAFTGGPSSNQGESTDRSDQESQTNIAEFRLAPNPASGYFQVLTETFPPETDVTLWDMYGRLLFQRPLNEGLFDLTDLPAGNYIVALRHGTKRSTAILHKQNH